MIHGFKGNKTTTAEEWLIDYSLRTGNSIDINTDLLGMSIKFNGKEVDAFILDIIDNKLVIQLALPAFTKFNDKSNRYETSYVRKLINSSTFLNRFNSEFVKCIQLTEIHTEDYVTNDKLWLLSHEEVINIDVSFFRSNHECHMFEMFKTIDLAAYSQMLLRLNGKKSYGWRLRSASSYTTTNDSKYMGCVDYIGNVNNYFVYYTCFGAIFPVCAIC